jgi:hypothetical protein
LAGLRSQSLNPLLQETTVHADATHFSTALFVLHAEPQAPQFLPSVVVFTQEASAPLPQSVGAVLAHV